MRPAVYVHAYTLFIPYSYSSILPLDYYFFRFCAHAVSLLSHPIPSRLILIPVPFPLPLPSSLWPFLRYALLSCSASLQLHLAFYVYVYTRLGLVFVFHRL